MDLPQVAAQLSGMAARLRAGQGQWEGKLSLALETLGAGEAAQERLRGKIASAHTTYLVAGLVEGLAKSCPPPALPADFAVMASDGSHIPPDRHCPVSCYLINIGVALIWYGASPGARLFSQPTLYSDPADLVIRDPVGARGEPVDGVVLGIKRTVAEVSMLADLLAEGEPALPLLCLMDGSLILWGLSGRDFPPFVREALLAQGFLPALERIKAAASDRPLALASYISQPGATEVVNTLRLLLCPFEPPNCDHFCHGGEKKCSALDGLEDRMLFSRLLASGDRSPLFCSNSSVLKQYGEHRVYFCYIRGQEEVARVEVPQWVAQDSRRMGLVHSLVLDQCRRGGGYPAVLQEAHQQAVLGAADRELFWSLVEQALWQQGLSWSYSAKRWSKRLPWV